MSAFLGQLWASLAVDTTQLSKAQQQMVTFGNQAEAAFSNVQKQLNGISSSMKQFGGDATRSLTVPIAALGTISQSVFKNYELTLAHIEGLTGTSAETTRKWSQEIQNMSTAVGKSPQELAEAMYFIASSGVEASKSMDVLTSSAKASAAGLGTTQQVADLVTTALNAYAGTGLTASEVTDQLTAAVREGKIEATQFAEHVGYAIPIAAQLGVSFDQVAAAMAAMSTVGADASTSATQLRQLLSDILKPAHQSEVALRNMGTSSAELQKILSTQGLMPALMKIRDLMSEFGQDAVAKTWPEVRALTGVLQLMGQNLQHNLVIFDNVKNSQGDMAKAFNVVTKTLDFQYKQALAESRIALIQFGQALKGPIISVLNGFVSTLRDLTKWFSSLSETQKDWIIGTAAALALIGPVSYAFGSLIGVLNGLVGVFKTLAVSIAVNPLMALAGVITGVTAALMISNNHMNRLYLNMEDINKAVLKNKQSIDTETSSIYSLFYALQNTNSGTEVRKNLIDEINSRYGQYLPQLITEKTSLEDILRIEWDLINAMQAKMAMQMQQAQISEILQKQMERNRTMLQSSVSDTAPMSMWLAAYNDYLKVNGAMTLDFSKGVDKISYKSASDEVNDLAKVTGRSLSEITLLFKSMSQYQKEDEKAMKGVIDQYKSYYDIINKTARIQKPENTITGTVTTSPEISISNSTKSIMAEMAKQEQLIADKANVMGMSFNANQEYIKLYEKTLDDLLNSGLKPTSSEIEIVKNKWATVNPVLADAQGIVEQLSTTMHGLVTMGMSKTGQDISDFSTNLKSLGKESKLLEDLALELEAIDIQYQILGSTYDDLSDKANAYLNTAVALKKIHTDGAEAKAEEYKQMYKQVATQQKLTSSMKQFGEQLQNALMNGAASWEEYGQSVKSTIRGIITALIAKALTEAIENAIGTASSMGPYGYLLIPALVGAAVGAANTAIEQIPGFAEGGVVPPGYPNDTYLARLTSGERIIPSNGDLSGLQNQNDTTKLTFDFRMSGRELRAILLQEEKITSKA